jgi:hypothetical protein
MSVHLSRRQMLSGTLASSGLGLLIRYPTLSFAQSAAPTPQCHDGDEATIRQTEGPYFKPSSPQRADLIEPDARARLVEVNGQVLTRSCRPIERALLDLWHADEHGEYDNASFRYRGHAGPSCLRSIRAVPDTITSKCRLRNGRFSQRSSIFPMNLPTGAMAYSAATW